MICARLRKSIGSSQMTKKCPSTRTLSRISRSERTASTPACQMLRASSRRCCQVRGLSLAMSVHHAKHVEPVGLTLHDNVAQTVGACRAKSHSNQKLLAFVLNAAGDSAPGRAFAALARQIEIGEECSRETLGAELRR